MDQEVHIPIIFFLLILIVIEEGKRSLDSLCQDGSPNNGDFRSDPDRISELEAKIKKLTAENSKLKNEKVAVIFKID